MRMQGLLWETGVDGSAPARCPEAPVVTVPAAAEAATAAARRPRATRARRDPFARAESGVARVIVADAAAVGRVALAAWLGSEPSCALVAAVGDARELASEAARTRADAVLICADRADDPLVAAARTLRSLRPGPRIVLLSTTHAPRSCATAEALRVPHAARTDPPADLLRRLRPDAPGEHAGDGRERCALPPAAADPERRLSRREEEVISLIARGDSAKQAAARLGISTKTVDNHLQRLMRKLDIHSRADLVLHAVRAGYVEV